ncbi:MAG: HNH endonuclease signature motif containing protein [Jatrophihabitans sp.]|uniref:HNH endonuclease signature motif containing protein n=1 Tax=Jatrophihabitans sp. TaxID=1932789 RepID=UPI0039162A72
MNDAAKPYRATVSHLSRPALALVGDDIPDAELSVDQLGSRIVGMAGRLASAMCRWLLLVAEFDARGGAAKFCLPTTSRWLGHYCGHSARTAREHVRAARVLAAYPHLTESFGAGRISYSHVRAIARAAELGGERLVTDLVMVAEHGTVGQLEDTVRGLRTVDKNNGGSPQPPSETVSHRWREDSHLGFSARVDPEHGALVLSAVDALARRENITHAEALTRMAEIALATVNNSDGPAPSLRGDEYAAIVINVDADQLRPDETERASSTTSGGEPQAQIESGSREPLDRPAGRIAGGPGLPDATVKRLLCSGRIRVVVTTDDSDDDEPAGAAVQRYRWRAGVLDVGANRRLVSDKQFRALMIRDFGCCTVPGCPSTIGLEAHHVQFWAWGGKTIMANLILLCRAHHHAGYDGAFRIVAVGDGRFRFHRPDGRELPVHSEPDKLSATPGRIEDEHDHVEPTAAITRWDGSHLDRHYAVATLAPGLTSAVRNSRTAFGRGGCAAAG